MKKLCILICCLAFANIAFAQKYIPKLGIGTVLNFDVEAVNMGQHVPLTLSVISLNDPMKFHWAVPSLGNGNFLVPVKSLESGTRMNIRVPEPDQDTKYKEDETILFISKSQFADMVKNQALTLNKIIFSVTPALKPFLINNQEADVIHLSSNKGKAELWIANNPDFPLICKMTGNPAGFDFELSALKE